MKKYIFLVIFLVFLFALISPYVFAHETDEPHEEVIPTTTSSAVRWPVVAGGGVIAVIVAALAYKFIIK